jgi:hypothetical protein
MPTGDMALLSYFSVKGKLYFIDKEMSIYNNGVEGSWTQRVRKNKDACLEYNRKLLLGFQEMEEHFLGKDYQKEIIKKKIQIVELEMEVAELRMKGDYRTIVSKHKTYIKKLSFKSRIKIYISCIFPRFIQWYNKRKK